MSKETTPSTRFWVSWIQPTDDYRPLNFPPHAPVLGWWRSGYNGNDDAILVALIEAPDEDAAELAVRHEWPEWQEWRFIDPCAPDFRPNDRFPLSEWMQERLATT